MFNGKASLSGLSGVASIEIDTTNLNNRNILVPELIQQTLTLLGWNVISVYASDSAISAKVIGSTSDNLQLVASNFNNALRSMGIDSSGATAYFISADQAGGITGGLTANVNGGDNTNLSGGNGQITITGTGNLRPVSEIGNVTQADVKSIFRSYNLLAFDMQHVVSSDVLTLLTLGLAGSGAGTPEYRIRIVVAAPVNADLSFYRNTFQQGLSQFFTGLTLNVTNTSALGNTNPILTDSAHTLDSQILSKIGDTVANSSEHLWQSWNDFTKGLGQGLGVSTPVVIAGLLLLGLIILKK
jgi:hypothetical protein